MIVKRNIDDPESCVNCGSKIGRLETPYLWDQHIVCESCFEKLSASKAKQKPVKIEYASIALAEGSKAKLQGQSDFDAALKAHHEPPGPPIICPNPACGYSGPGKRIAKGSQLAGCLLCLLFLLPGLLYLMIMSGSHIVCPKCGLQIRDE
jgi:hypothetical protein